MRRYSVMLAAIALVGCATQPAKPQHGASPASGNQAQSTPGYLQPANPLGCVSLSDVTAGDTPADIYHGMKACIQAGQFDKAVPLYAIAGTFARFDKLRVADKSAEHTVKVLQRLNLEGLDAKQRKGFGKAMRMTLAKGSKSFNGICAAIERTGPPTYYPSYMLGGAQPAAGHEQEGLTPGFITAKGWRRVVTGYLGCPWQ